MQIRSSVTTDTSWGKKRAGPRRLGRWRDLDAFTSEGGGWPWFTQYCKGPNQAGQTNGWCLSRSCRRPASQGAVRLSAARPYWPHRGRLRDLPLASPPAAIIPCSGFLATSQRARAPAPAPAPATTCREKFSRAAAHHHPISLLPRLCAATTKVPCGAPIRASNILQLAFMPSIQRLSFYLFP